MVGQRNEKLNQLHRLLPEGLVVDTSWLEARGYRRQWREKYVNHGWLQGVARGVYRRPSSEERLAWQRVVISLQQLLDKPVHVGGRSALDLQGLTHYVQMGGDPRVELYAYDPLPGWTFKVPTDAKLVEQSAAKLFAHDSPGLTELEWGHWGWKIRLSAPERALCELFDELPERETFHQADMLMESAGTLSPKRVQAILEACRSVKVKRLFLWFAEKQGHAWFGRLDLARVDLGRGKRQIVKNGRFDPKYQITVPDTLDDGG